MNVDFSTLAIISVLTTLATEAIKILMNKANKEYVSNIIAAIVSVVISLVITVIRPMVMNGVPLSPALIYTGIVMAFFGVLCSTLTFDKIKQALDKLHG